MRIAVAILVSLTGCHLVFGLDPTEIEDACAVCAYDADACPRRCWPDASVVGDSAGGDGADGDAPDASIDAPPPECTAHVDCSSMVSGTCCVDPGLPTAHCEVGTVLGGGFCYTGP